MKKHLFFFLVAILVVTTGCGTKNASSNVDYKIGIVTGTVSQGEEEFPCW